MKYQDIKLLVEKYGEDNLFDGDIKRIFNIIQDSPMMQKQLEAGINEQWIEQLKKAGKIYVYTDHRKASIFDQATKPYPFMEVTLQDEHIPGKEPNTIPVLRYVCKETRQYRSVSRKDIARETERRMNLKGLMQEEK